MATALAAALTKGSLMLSHTTCFGCGQKGHWNRVCPEGKVIRSQSMSHHEENLICAHVAIKVIIGLKSVNLNIMLMGNL
jgi:hypothetical protein